MKVAGFEVRGLSLISLSNESLWLTWHIGVRNLWRARRAGAKGSPYLQNNSTCCLGVQFELQNESAQLWIPALFWWCLRYVRWRDINESYRCVVFSSQIKCKSTWTLCCFHSLLELKRFTFVMFITPLHYDRLPILSALYNLENKSPSGLEEDQAD